MTRQLKLTIESVFVKKEEKKNIIFTTTKSQLNGSHTRASNNTYNSDMVIKEVHCKNILA